MTTISRESALNTVIRDQLETRLKRLHTTTPGIVTAFDPETKRASIQPSIQRVLVNGTFQSLPSLINVPIGNIRAGGFTITVPVQPGDECIIHFTERSLDNWIKTGEVREPNDLRLHSESDAYFIPTTTSEPNGISDYDPTNFVIRNDANTQKLVLQPDGQILLETEADITLTTESSATINTEGATTINANEATINTDADTTINAGGDCNINGTTINNNGSAAGVVTTLSINPITGTPFPDGSDTLRNIDG